MPAGIVKTPSSVRTKDAAVAKSAEKTASGGKKFVQTRLPFKMITPGGGAGATASSSSSSAGPVTVILDDEDPVPRKRKLSYDDETPQEGTGSSAAQLRRSNSKENLDLASSIATKKAKTADIEVESLAEDVIELDDDEGDEEEKDMTEEIAPVKKTTEAKPKTKKPVAKKASPAPIQIKLPLVNKRSKRRKSLKKSEEALDTSAKDVAKTGSESSDDIEALAEELNPQKKLRVQVVELDSPEESPKNKEKEEEKVSQNEKKDPKKQKEAKDTSKESKKEESKLTEQNKKNDQSTIDLFIAKKAEAGKKEVPENKKRNKSIVEDSKPKETTKQDKTKAAGKLAKEESKSAEKHDPEENEASSTKSQKEKDNPPAKNQKEELSNGKNQKEEASKKSQIKETEKKAESPKEKPSNEIEQDSGKTKKDEPSAPEKSEKGTPEDAEISVILSSSEDNSSSSEHEMDVDTDVQKDVPHNRRSLPEATDSQKTLTPKQQKLLERRKKAREEKEQKLAEERRLKQQEKEQREQQKKQERDEKEQQRKMEKDQKEQQKKMEKEEKERKRQAEVDSKNEEKRKRNEAKEEVQRKKDEERRKKEQEREEAEQKKKRAAESFTKFFVPKQPKTGGGSNATSYLEHEQSSCDSSKASSQLLAFRPFQVKDDMLLAPIVRASLGQEQRSQLDGLFKHHDEDDDDDEEEEGIVRRKPPNRAHLYLSELSNGRRLPLKMLRDARLQRRTKDEEEEDEVQVIDDLSTAGLPIEEEQPKQLARMRAKYLHFADNRRPPYYGTWRKKSTSISARHPLAQDKVHFDYELDSDCEWEEEEPGESLSASEDEKERESEEESEEEYNEWYVPHGHLSDEELQNDGDGEMDDGHTREAQKAKLQVLQQEFAQEMKKQTKKIKPRLLGPVWLDENGNKSELFPAIFAHTIDMYACWQTEPLSLEPPPEPEREDQPPEQPVPLQLDDRLLQQLVRLTHGNRNSKTFLINEYLEYLKTQPSVESNQTLLPSKTVLREKFDELASWKTVELGTPEAAATNATSAKKTKKPKKRVCWVVATELLEKYQLPELPLQNQWDYTLTPKVSEGADAAQHEQSPPAEAEATASPVVASVANSTSPTTPVTGQSQATPGAKKRATLIMSVPRDQPIPTATKNKLISQFLRRQNDASSPKDKPQDKAKEKPPPAVSEDVVMLSD